MCKQRIPLGRRVELFELTLRPQSIVDLAAANPPWVFAPEWRDDDQKPNLLSHKILLRRRRRLLLFNQETARERRVFIRLAPTAGRTQAKCCARTMTRADLRATRSEIAERRFVIRPPLLETLRSTT